MDILLSKVPVKRDPLCVKSKTVRNVLKTTSVILANMDSNRLMENANKSRKKSNVKSTTVKNVQVIMSVKNVPVD